MRRRRIVTAFWHSVEPDTLRPEYLDGSNPTVSLFRQQLEFLCRNYTPISNAEFLAMRNGERPSRAFERPPILLGFDDGFKNVIVNALPILNEFRVPATMFVIGESLRDPSFVPWFVELTQLVRNASTRVIRYDTELVDLNDPVACWSFKRKFQTAFRACRSNAERDRLLSEFAGLVGVSRPAASELDDDLRLVDVDDLKGLDATALLTIGSHAMTHRHLASLSYEEQRVELEASDAILRQHCPLAYSAVVAYPAGSFDRDTVTIARTIYRAGFAVFLGSSHRNPYAYPRVGLSHQTVRELRYVLSACRLNFLLPVKRLLHEIGVRRVD